MLALCAGRLASNYRDFASGSAADHEPKTAKVRSALAGRSKETVRSRCDRAAANAERGAQCPLCVAGDQSNRIRKLAEMCWQTRAIVITKNSGIGYHS